MTPRRWWAVLIVAAALPTLAGLTPALAQTTGGQQSQATTAPSELVPGDAPPFVPPRPSPSTTTDALAAAAGFQITYDAAFPSAGQAAVQRAVDIWSNLLASSVPIHLQVNYTSQAPNALGFATFPTRANFPSAPVANTWYPGALAEALAGGEVVSGTEITVNVAIRSNWYFGTDGNPPSGSADLVSVMLHEILHGLGFASSFNVSGGNGSWGSGGPGYPTILDRFVEDAGGARLLDTSTYPNPSVALADPLTGGAVFFDSPRTNRNNNDRPQLYAPATFSPISSIVHWNESTYPGGTANALITPTLITGEAVHSPGPLALCALEAMGWTTPQDCTPPALTSVTGFVWYTDGSDAKSGPSGTSISAYGTGLFLSTNYQLVTGVDGGPQHPCMWDVQPVNPNTRRSSTGGLIGNTVGPVNRTQGKWQLCFRQVVSGNLASVGFPKTFTVP
ncbi:MAG: hypothetical protein ACRD12_19220 [Acidimicrobiales bacterium]